MITPPPPLTVTLLMRPRTERSYSIEAVFDTVAAHLPPDIAPTALVPPHRSRGFWPRLRGIWHVHRATREAGVVHMTGDAHYLVLGLPRGKAVLTVHDCDFLEQSRGLKRFVLWLIWLRLPAAWVAAITVVSDESKRRLLSWLRIDPDRIEVIENPLSKPFPRDDRPFDSARPRLMMVGTGPHKNIDRVAEAVAGLPVVLEVIGWLSADRLARLRAGGLTVETCHDLSDAELAQAYRRADILMFPSLAEGFGLPILEAQSVGRPVVTSDRAPMRDVAGEAALKVDPEDGRAIRAAVERLIVDPSLRAKLVEAGFDNVAHFAPERAAARYADLYRRIAAGVA